MQNKKWSFAETCVSTFIGLAVSFTMQLIIFPLYRIEVNLAVNLHILFWFTLASIARGYFVRRLFNWWHHRPVEVLAANDGWPGETPNTVSKKEPTE